MKAFWLALFLTLAHPALANSIADLPFSTSANEARYKDLIEELRCLVCQNQNLADSDAELAHDLRKEVFRMIEAGKSDREVLDFMVARYGDFVLYRPPLQGNTAFLWIGPFLIVGMGIVIAIIFARRHRLAPGETTESEDGARSQ